MAGQKISDMATKATLNATDRVPIVSSGPTGSDANYRFNLYDAVTAIASGTGAVARTVPAKLRDIVSVADFGAVGDGATDCTAALQAAINFVQSTVDFATYASNSPGAGPQELFLPAGIYRITAPLVITRSMSFRGDGHSEYSGGTRIEQQTSATDVFRVNPIAAGCSVSWTDLTIRHNGGGGTNGSGIHITKASGTCNSVRVIRCTFGPPQKFAINVECGDDLLIDGCLFDDSATTCLALGTATAANLVTNARIVNSYFFSIDTQAILLYNVDGVLIANNIVYTPTRTQVFVDGYNSTPYQIANVSVIGNRMTNVDCATIFNGATGFLFSDNTGNGMGLGTGATASLIEPRGICTRVVVSGNALSGNVDTKSFYDDSSSTSVTKSLVTGNTFEATGGTGAAIKSAKTDGVGQNICKGFTPNSVGHRWATTGSSMTPGTITTLSSATVNLTVTGALQSDFVDLTPSSTSWFAPVGIVVTAYVSAPNTLTVKYANVTAGSIGVSAHDITAMVTR